MSGRSEGLHGLGDGPERRSPSPDRTHFLRPGYRSERTQLSIEEKNSILDEVSRRSREAGKGKSILDRIGIEYNSIDAAVSKMDYDYDAKRAIVRKYTDELKSRILGEISEKNWKNREGKSIKEYIQIDCKSIDDALKEMGYDGYTRACIVDSHQNKLKYRIFDEVSEKNWEEGKGKSIKERMQIERESIRKAIDEIGSYEVALIMYKYIDKLRDRILDEVSEKNWEEGKGKPIDERMQMERDSIIAAVNEMPYDDDEKRTIVDDRCEKMRNRIKAMGEDINRWKNEGLPERGWPRKNYEDEQAMLSASDKAIYANSSKTDTGCEKIQQLYWSYGARANLNIDASKLNNSTYERMYDHFSELEAAENKFRSKVKKMCLFHNSVAGTKRIEGMKSLPAEKFGAIMSALAKSWLDPSREKYNEALEATEEAYMRILAERILIRHILQRRRSDSVDPL